MEQEPDVHGTVVGPDGHPVDDPGSGAGGERPVTDLVEQPAKVMRIGNMIRITFAGCSRR